MTDAPNYDDLGRGLNGAIARSFPAWGELKIWDQTHGEDRASHTHRLLSAILSVIGTSPPLWAVAHVDTGEDTEASTAYTLTVWTDDLVVTAVREAGEEWPVVTASPRTTLSAVEVLKSQILTFREWGAPDRGMVLRLTYGGRLTVTIEDPRSTWLPTHLPALLDDLKATS